MFKYSILLFSSVALFAHQTSFAEVITVTRTMPSSAKSDSEFIVELTITKGTSEGFASLLEELPIGFTAVEDKNGGASFSFNKQSVKFLWISLPTDKIFKVSYKVHVEESVTGDKIISGNYFYVFNDTKQSITIPSSSITVISLIPKYFISRESNATNIQNIKTSSSTIPNDLVIADKNNDGKITPDEITTAIDFFFDGDKNYSPEKLKNLVDYFFE